jgi:hypothetical protein
MASKERLIEIYEYKISEMDRRILASERIGVSEKKIKKLTILKSKYKKQLEKILKI